MDQGTRQGPSGNSSYNEVKIADPKAPQCQGPPRCHRLSLEVRLVLRARWGSGSDQGSRSRPLATEGLQGQKHPLRGSECPWPRAVLALSVPFLTLDSLEGPKPSPWAYALKPVVLACAWLTRHHGSKLPLTQQKLLTREQQSESPRLGQQATPEWTLRPKRPWLPCPQHVRSHKASVFSPCLSASSWMKRDTLKSQVCTRCWSASLPTSESW